jgi:hypothetical protein
VRSPRQEPFAWLLATLLVLSVALVFVLLAAKEAK